MGAEALGTAQKGSPPPQDGEEVVLLHAAQAGDRDAFAEIVKRYWPRLFRWLYHLTHDRHLAEDVAQETFLKALAHLDRFRVGTNFRAWLFRIGHNAFANVHRATARRRSVLPDDLPTREQGPVEKACSKEAIAGLAEAVDRLGNEFKAALLLRVEEGLSFRQIAGVMDITEETARWRVFKARQKLLGELDREGQ